MSKGKSTRGSLAQWRRKLLAGSGLSVTGTLAAALMAVTAQASVVTIENGDTIDINGAMVTGVTGLVLIDGQLIDAAIVKGSISISESISVQKGLISARLAGIASLSKTTADMVTLSGANTYSGGSTISDGTLRLEHNTALGSGTLVATGGVLDLEIGLNVANIIEMQASGFAVNVGGAGVTATLSGIIREETSSYGFNKTGGGNLRLTGANTFTGLTTVEAGELTITGAGLLVADVELIGGAFLTFDKSGGYTYDKVVQGTGRLSATSGPLTLTQSQSLFDSFITINPNASVILGSGASLGGSSNAVEIHNVGTLDLGGTTQNLKRVDLFGVDSLAQSGILDVTDLVAIDAGSITANIRGTTAVLKEDATGLATLSGNNTYTGATTINLGTLLALNGRAIGDRSAVTVGPDGILKLGADEVVGSLAGAGNVELESHTLRVGPDDFAYDTTFSGLIAGTGTLHKDGAGKLTLTNQNDHTGGTKFAGGTLRVEHAGALGVGQLQIVPVVTSLPESVHSILSYDDGIIIDNSIELGSDIAKFSVDAGDAAEQNNTISENAPGRPVTKIGAGKLTFSWANTYSGQTRVYGGTLAISGSGTLGNNSYVVVDNSSVLDLGGTTQIVNGLNLIDGTVQNGLLSATSGYSVQKGQISANLTGSGGLLKSSPETVRLSGEATFSGPVQINGGTLEVTGGLALTDSEDVTIDSGGVLSVLQSENFGSLAGAGSLVVDDAATIAEFGFNGASTNFSGVISGAGYAIKNGAGTMTLSNTNTISQFWVRNGTVVLEGGNAIDDASTVWVFGPGIIKLGANETIGSLQDQTAGLVDTNGFDLTVLSGSAFGDITGNGKLIKSGPGAFNLILFPSSAPKSLTGGIEVTDGTLAVDIVTADPAGSLISAGGIITMSGTSTLEYTPWRGPLNDQIVLAGSEVNLKVEGGPAIQGGVINGGANGIRLVGNYTGTLKVTAANTYTGATIADSAVLNIGGGGATGSVAGDIVNNIGVYFERSDDVNFGNKLSGSGFFFHIGTGILTLSSTASDFDGVFSLMGSKLALTPTAVFGNGQLQLSGGAELDLGGSTQSASFLQVNDSVVKNGTLNVSGSITLGGGEISANLGGTGNLMWSLGAAPDTILSGSNTFKGRLLLGDGNVRLRGGEALDDTVDVRVFSLAKLYVEASETLDMLSGDGTVDIAAGNILSVGGGGSTGSIFDNDFSGVFAGAGGLRKTGAGTQILTSVDLSSLNGLDIADGVLAFAGTVTVGGTPVELSGASGTLDIFGIAGAGIDIDVIFGGGGINLGDKLLTTGASGFDATIGGVISGDGSLKKTGIGVLTLSGNNTFGGGIDLAQGTLRLAHNNAAGTGAITTTGSVISFANGVNNVAPIVINSATTQLEVLTGHNATQSGVISEIAGPRPLEKIGGGFLGLSAASTYTGLTTITDGRLQLIGAGTVSDTVHVAGVDAWLDFVRTDTYTYGGVISGTNISQQGSGTLILTGANTHTWTGISDGTVRLEGAGTLGATNSTLSISGFGVAPATVDLGGTTQSIGLLRTFNGYSAQVINGTLNVANFIFPDAGLFSASLGGTATLVKNSAGTTTLSGTNTFTGDVTLNAGTLVLQNGNAIDDGVGISGFGGVLQIDGAEQIFSLSGAFDTVLNANLVIDGSSATGYSGVISGAGGVYHYGTGTLELTGLSTYTGGTSIESGTIVLGGTDGEIAGDVLVASGATLEFNRSNPLSFGGVISGAGTVRQNNPTGVITLTAANTLQGVMSVTDGTLAVSGAGTFGDGISVTLSANGPGVTVDLGGTSQSVFTLNVDQGATVTGAPGSTLTVGPVPDFSSINVGTGTITVDLSGIAGLNKNPGSGANTATLSGNNTFTGTTQVFDGTLILQGGAALADTNLVVVSAGATLQVDADETIRALINNGGVALGANTLTLNYAVQNIGTISGTGNSLVVDQGTTISVENLGLIESTGVGGVALRLASPMGGGPFAGTVDNSGTIRATLSGTALSIESGVGGVILNSGTLEGGVALNLDSNAGFEFLNSGTLAGNLDAQNSGADLLRFSGGSLFGNLQTDTADTVSIEGGNWNFGVRTIAELRVLGGGLTGGAISAGAFYVETGTIAADLSGAGGLAKTTGGTVTLSGTNTYSGPTTINGGTLALQGGAALADTNAVTVASGATLRIDSEETIGSIAGAGTLNLTTKTLTVGNSSNTSWTGTVVGGATSGLQKVGSGILSIAGDLNHESTTIQAGELNFNGTALGDIAINTGASLSGTHTISGDLFNLGTLASGNSPGTTTVLGNYTGGGTLEVEVQFDNAGAPVNGVTHDFLNISGNVLGAPTAVNILTFAPFTSPAATVGNGIEIVRVGGASAAGDFTMTSYLLGSYYYDIVHLPDYSGSLDGFFLQSSLATPGCVVDGLDNACFIDDAENTIGAAVDALAGNDTLQLMGATDFTFDVARIGTTYTNFEVFQKADTNTVTLSGVAGFNTLGFDIQNGTLIAGSNQLGSLGRVNIFTLGTLQLASALTVGSIAGSGDIALGGSKLTAGSDNTSTLFSGVISGTGNFDKQGSGTLTLSGANTFSGTLSLNEGRIDVTGAGKLGAATAGLFVQGTLDLGGTAQTVGSLFLASGSIQGGSLIVNGDAGAQVGTISADLTVTGTLSVPFSFGSLTLSGNNTLTNVLIGAGDLFADGEGAITDTASVNLAWSGIGFDPRFKLLTNQTVGSISSDVLGAIDLGAFALTTGGNNASTTFAGGIFGAGGKLIKTGSGTMTLSANNSFTGGLDLMAGTLRLANNGAAGTGPITTFGSVIDYADGVSSAAPIVINSATTQLQVSSGVATQSGVISELGGPRPLEKTGAGNLILSGANTYTGLTTVTEGRLQLGTGGSLAGNVHVGSGANTWFDFAHNGSGTFAGSISGGQVGKIGTGTTILTGANTNSYLGVSGGTIQISGGGTLVGATGRVVIDNGAIDLGGSTQNLAQLISPTTFGGTRIVTNGTVNATGSFELGAGTFGANLAGSAGLLKSGAGTTTLSGTNTYTGATTVDNGTLILLGGAAVSDTSEVTVNAGGTLELANNETIGLLQGSGDVQLGVHDLTLYAGGVSTFSGVISGSGGLRKPSNGNNIYLLGENTYTGATEIFDGLISLGNGGASGSIIGDIVLHNAILAFHRTSDFVYGGSISGDGIVHKTSLNKVTLTGTNGFSGVFNIVQGTLAVSGGVAISDNAAVGLGGGGGINPTLELLSNETIGGFSGNSFGIYDVGTIDLGSSALTFGGNDVDAFWDGVINGTASSQLIKEGAGTQFVASNLDLLGTTIINAGELNFNGTALGSVVVNDGGRLSGSHTINGNLTLASGGVLATGNSPGSTTVLGNFAGGGALDVEVQFDNAGAPDNGVTHDFLDIAGNVTGGTTTINLLTFAPLGTPSATTGDGVELVRVGGTSNVEDFFMEEYLLGDYFYNLVYLSNYEGSRDSFFLQSTLAIPGCAVTTENDACFIDAATDQSTAINALAGTDVLQLTGAVDFDFNVGAMGTTFASFEQFQKAGTSTVTLTGTASVANLGVDVQNGILIAGTGQLGALGEVTILTLGILQTTGNLQTGSLAGTGTLEVQAGEFQTGANNASTNFSGAITGDGDFQKTGTDTLTLSGTNTLSGYTSIIGGTLEVDGGAAINDLSRVILDPVGTLRLLTDETIGSLEGTLVSGGNVDLGAHRLTLGGNNFGTYFTGILSGTGGLTVVGSPFAGITLGGANTFTGNTIIDGSQVTLAGPSGALAGGVQLLNDGRLTFARGTDYTYGGAITGDGTVRIVNDATTTWTGANSFSGALEMRDGTLALAPGAVLGATDLFVDFFGVEGISLATLDLGGTTQTIGGLKMFGGTVENGMLNFLTVSLEEGEISANLIGAGMVTKSTSGTFTLSGANTYSGATNILGGTMIANGGAAIGDASAVTVAAGATFQLGANETVGSIAGAGAVTLGANALTAGGDNSSTLLSGVVSGLGGKLIKTGAGMLTLSGNNSFSGGIDILSGGVSLASNTAAGTGPITTFGSVIDYANGVNIAAPIIVNSTTTQLQVLAGVATQAGNISELGGQRPLEKTGAGELILSGSNSWSGATTISQGTLTAQGGAAIGDLSAVTVTGGATFQLGANETVGSIAGPGAVTLGANAITIRGNGASTILSGVVSGLGGRLVKEGTGSLILTNSNTYTGGTTVNGGFLYAYAIGSLGTGNVAVAQAGRLRFDLLASAQSLGITSDGLVVFFGNSTAANANIINTGIDPNNFSNSSLGLGFHQNASAGQATITNSGSLGFYNQTTAASANITHNSGVMGFFNSASAGSATIINNASAPVFGQRGLGFFDAAAAGAGNITNNGDLAFFGSSSAANSILTNYGRLAFSDSSTAGNSNVTVAAGLLAFSNTASAGTATITLSGSSTLDIAGMTTGGLSINTLASTSSLSLINLGANTLTLGGSGTNTTVAALVQGVGGITKTSNGTLTLSGANTYFGETYIEEGTLIAQGGAAIGDLSAVTMEEGATLLLSASETVGSLAGMGGVALGVNTLTTGGDNTSTTFAGVISGAGGVTKTGTGAFVLSGANTFSGPVAIQGGTLALQGGVALIDAMAVDISTGAALQLLNSETLGTVTGAGAIAFGGNTLSVGGTNASFVFMGQMSGAGGLTKLGSGTMTLSGLNTYSGATALSAGTLTLSGGSAIGDLSALSMNAGTTLNLGDAETIGSLSGTGTVALGANTLTTGGNNATTSFAGVISGAGGLAKTGTGVFTLTGANTYSGQTSVLAGSLVAGSAQAFGTGSALFVDAGGAASLGGFNMTIGAIGGAGQLDIAGVTLTTGAAGSSLFSGNIVGSGGKIAKTGAGILTLAGNNTFSGGIDILQGGISLQSNTAAGTGPITTFGSIIDYANGVNIATPIILSSNDTQLRVLVGAATQSGAISEVGGSRPLEKIGVGNLTLSGANSFTGIMTVTDGTLTVSGGSALSDSSPTIVASTGALAVASSETVGALSGSGALNLSSGATLTTGGNNTSTIFAGSSSGAGGMTKTGSGTFLLTGANSFSGLLNVAGGTLTVTPGGSLANMSLNVGAGASARLGAGSFGVNGGGTVGTSMGALSVAAGGSLYLDDNTDLNGASVTLASGSSLGVFLTTDTTTYAQINVSGTANIGGDLGVFLDPVTFGGTTATAFTYDNVISGASRAGTFGSVNLLQTPNSLFSVAAIYGTNDVDLQVTRSSFAGLGGPGGNQNNVGGAIETIFVSGSSNPDILNLINTVAGASPADILILYSNVSGSLNAEVEAAGFRTDDPWKQTVAERVNAARAPGCAVAGDTWCLRRYAQAASPVMSDVQGDPSAFDWLQTGIREDGTTSAWMRAVGAWAEADSSLNAPGSTQWTGGVIGGLDRVFDSLLLAGVAGQYLETNVDFDKSTNKSNVKAVQLGSYLSYGGAEAYVNANVSVIGSTAKSERRLTVGTLNYDIDSFLRSWTYTFAAEAGTIIEEDGFRFEPSFALNFQHGKTGDYTESNGGGLALRVRPDEMLSLRSILTARLSQVIDIGDRKIVPQIKVDWRHEMLDRGQGFNAAFTGAPDVWFKVDGTEIGRDTFTLGAAITMPIAGRVTGYVDAQGSMNEDVVSGMASVGVRATW